MCEETADDIYRAGKIKPVSAYVAGMSASACYWMISNASAGITATPSAEIGSVGVRTASISIRGALQKAGIRAENYVSKISPYKAEGSELEDPSDEMRAAIQADLDHIADKFVRSIVRGRGVSAAKVKSDFGRGRVLFSQVALAAQMIGRDIAQSSRRCVNNDVCPSRRASRSIG